MIINGLDLLKASPIKNMETEKKRFNGRSYGLAEVGYDIRLKQKIVFEPSTVWSPRGKHKYNGIWNDSIRVDEELIIGNFCLASSMEEFTMPDNLVGIVHDKSTNIREGIQVFNTVIEPAWNGFLTIEIAFHGNKPITLEAGTPIAQIIFHEVLNKAEYTGKYQGQEDKPVEAMYD